MPKTEVFLKGRPLLAMLGIISLITCFPSSSSQLQSAPTATCSYDPDTPPKQIGPGNENDSDYNFYYVSDYEESTGTFRRRICNSSARDVHFDWTTADLKGVARSNGLLSAETPYPVTPRSDTGSIRYDYRSLRTTGYIFDPPRKHQLWPTNFSTRKTTKLSGYVSENNELRPVRLQIESENKGDEFLYSFSAQSETRVRISCKEFTALWRRLRPEEYARALSQLVKQEAIVSSSDASPDGFTLLPKAQADWRFTFKGVPEVVYSTLEIYSATGQGKEADLTTRAPLYLPAQ